MSAYRIMLSKGGQRSVVVIDADSEQEAVERILSTGASVLAVEEVRVQVFGTQATETRREQAEFVEPPVAQEPYADLQSSRSAASRSAAVSPTAPGRWPDRRGSDWSRFWSFRLMLTPSIIRWVFVICSVCLVGYMVVYPIYFLQQRGTVGAAEVAEVRRLEAALPRIRSLREQWERDRSEVDRLGSQEGYREAAAEARAKATKSEGALNGALRDAGIARGMGEDEAVADARQALQIARQSAPSARDLALNLASGVVLWIVLRLLCECSIIFFRIHEQLVAISDRVTPGDGA